MSIHAVLLKRILTALLVLTSSSALAKQWDYHGITLEGWKVYIEQSMVNNNDPRVFSALRVLKNKFIEIKTLLKPHQLAQLKNVPFWISRNAGNNAEFYFFEQRIHRHEKNPEMMDGIEFQDISGFLHTVQRKPMIVLHELAHAYHKKNYERIDKKVMRAYRNARSERLYRKADKHTGETQDAYAAKNGFEYFAELTEAYFGRNNDFPHNRSELRRHDPMGYEMVESIWK